MLFALSIDWFLKWEPIKHIAMSKGKLLFISPSANVLGGVQTWLSYLLPGLCEFGWEVVLGLTKGTFHCPDSYLKSHFYDNVVVIQSKTGSKEGRIRAIEKAIRQTAPDIVVSVNVADVYAAANRLKTRKPSSVKCVATCHGVQKCFFEDYRRFSDSVEAVVSTNRLTQALVKKVSGIDSDRSMYAPYGVELHPESIVGGDSQDLKRSFTIAYVGRFEEKQKRITDLLSILDKIVKDHPKTRVLMAGDGPDRDKVESWLEKTKSDKVTYFGELLHSDLQPKIYDQCDVLLLTSHWETGPIVAWEAMSRGVVLVTSRYIGSQHEGSLFNQSNCLMFEAGDIEQAVAQLNEARNKTLRGSLSSNGYEMVTKNYSRKRSLEIWDDCFHRVMGLPHKTPKSKIDVTRDEGRLTNLFGENLAESIRELSGQRFKNMDAGSEWPHSFGSDDVDISTLLSVV